MQARDLIQKLIVGEPEKRLTLQKIRRHPWFTPEVEWDKVQDGLLKMPKVTLRKIVKSDLPYNFNDDSEDDDYFEKKEDEHESSIMKRPEEAGDGMMGDDVPVMLEVQVSPTNPIDELEAEERKMENSGGFEFDDSKMGHIPHTVDVGGKYLKDGNNGMAPTDLYMTDTNLLAMRVPNFSYHGDE